MASRAALIPHYTVADLEAWEDRWELLGGVPHAMSPAPNLRHQRISGRLHTLLEEALADCGPCVALLAANWRISDDTVVIPDNLVVCTDRPLEGVYLTEPPVLIAEVFSPSTALKDRTVKRALYEEQGVRHYVMIDPEAETAEGLEPHDGRYRRQFDTAADPVDIDFGPCAAGLDVGRLWPR